MSAWQAGSPAKPTCVKPPTATAGATFGHSITPQQAKNFFKYCEPDNVFMMKRIDLMKMNPVAAGGPVNIAFHVMDAFEMKVMSTPHIWTQLQALCHVSKVF